MKKIFKIPGVILLLLTVVLIHSCRKDKPAPPAVTTTAVSEISYTTAVSGGDVTNEGGTAIISRGVCWNTSADPAIMNSKTTEIAGLGPFTSSITRMTPNTTYYLRAYATNSDGTGYGNQVTFATSQVEVPILTTAEITSITQTTAISGGNITDDKGGSVTARGVCWGILANPTTANSITTNETGTGTFTSSITGLTKNTTYYVRAYATNSMGTGYGDTRSFTAGTVTDIEGIVYHTITIGNQEWMVENLKVTKYNNGDIISTTTPATLNIYGESAPKYQWAYSGNNSFVTTYGRLYTWYAATDSRGLCPTGWHVPTDTEWHTLALYLDAGALLDFDESQTAGGKLKETGTINWSSPNTGASNETGFSALPGGERVSFNSQFYAIGENGFYMSSTEYGNDTWYRGMYYNNSGTGRYPASKKDAFSVRCLKD
jgi:uncharacterized protein (TIGR02145 family)